MTSVKKADPNKTRIVTVMNNIVGPFSIERVLRAIQKSTLRTINSMKIARLMQTNKIHKAVSPLPAFTRATLRASNVHPLMSLPDVGERNIKRDVLSHKASIADNPTLSSINNRFRIIDCTKPYSVVGCLHYHLTNSLLATRS